MSFELIFTFVQVMLLSNCCMSTCNRFVKHEIVEHWTFVPATYVLQTLSVNVKCKQSFSNVNTPSFYDLKTMEKDFYFYVGFYKDFGWQVATSRSFPIFVVYLIGVNFCSKWRKVAKPLDLGKVGWFCV